MKQRLSFRNPSRPFPRVAAARPANWIVDGVAEIPLTRGFVTLIDAADVEAVCAKFWHTHFCDGRPYAATMIGRRRLTLHRFLLQCPADMFVDHADGDGLNNRRSNIRRCTASQNVINRRGPAGASGYRGVQQNSGCSTWRAMIHADGRKFRLGSFADKEDAARAYDRAAIRLHGEFAVLNFPPPGWRSAA